MMVETYGASPESKAALFRIGSQTAGSTIVPQQPLNNLIRIAYQALAGALAGVSSIHCCRLDEAIGLPSPTAHRLAVRTQQILAYETGVPLVADPLGGSYYIEHLTRQLIDECDAIMREVDTQGGMLQCVRNGWLDEQLKVASLRQVAEIETGERHVVGVNWAVEEAETSTPFGIHEFSTSANDARIHTVKQYKEFHDQSAVSQALRQLQDQARSPQPPNLVPTVQRALLSSATLAEIVGTLASRRACTTTRWK